MNIRQKTGRQWTFQTELPVPSHEAFEWALGRGALERLLPPWAHVSLLFPPDTKVGLKLRWGFFSVRAILERTLRILDLEMDEIQVRGPFRHFQHRQRFVPNDPLSCTMVDDVTCAFALPFCNPWIEAALKRYFTWRHALIREDLKLIGSYPRRHLRILLSGSSGFIGTKLKVFLELAGHEIVRLVRERKALTGDAIFWDPLHGEVDKGDFEGFDAVIHLAGQGIAQKRWTPKIKEQLASSRIRDTRLLAQVLCGLQRPPATFIGASAIGFYGNRGHEELSEDSQPGKGGFLTTLAGEWEKASEPLKDKGIRVVHARFAAVLGAGGGMLAKLLPVYRSGLGGKVGSGSQLLSWIGIDDLLGGLYHCLMNPAVNGPVNFAAPQALSQEEFSRILAKKVGRPAFCHVPAFLLKLAMGEMGQELILSSQNVKPVRLLQTGFVFRYPDLKTALDFVM